MKLFLQNNLEEIMKQTMYEETNLISVMAVSSLAYDRLPLAFVGFFSSRNVHGQSLRLDSLSTKSSNRLQGIVASITSTWTPFPLVFFFPIEDHLYRMDPLEEFGACFAPL